MSEKIKLISHLLCPYAQRVAIVLSEKNIPYERLNIDLANKPSWFLSLSPTGKTPVLVVDDQVIFESLVICEYLEETYAPSLHPSDLIRKAQHRAWMEFGSSILVNISTLYSTKDLSELNQTANAIHQKMAQLEHQLGVGPYFEEGDFSMVDAVYGSIFRYFNALDKLELFSFFKDLNKVQQWRAALSERASIQHAVTPDYEKSLYQFLINKPSKLAHIMNTFENCCETMHSNCHMYRGNRA
jgi:glutathione S-transferase